MSMLPKLNLPANLARWATAAGRVLEPDSSFKDSGWTDSTKPPARWQNWMQNLNYQWTQRIGAMLVGNWQVISATITTQTFVSVIFHPTMEEGGLWMAFDDAEDAWKSNDGRTWTSAGTNILNSTLNATIAIDSSNVIVGGAHSGSMAFAYTSDKGATWNVDTGIPETTQVGYVVSKYPDSDLLLACPAAAVRPVYRAVGGVGTAWVTATTSPSFTMQHVVRAGDSTFIGVGADCWISTDDGDNWTQTAQSPADVGLTDRWDDTLTCDRELGTIAMGGREWGGSWDPRIAVSRDLGNSWALATIHGIEETGMIQSLYACGGGIWYAGGTVSGFGSGAGFVSFDDAENFYPASFIGDYIAPSRIKGLASDGRKLLAVREDQRVMHSLAVPGIMP